MEGAFAWLSQIIEALLQFIPQRVIIKATERGVKWTAFRREPVEMKPGLRIWWPLTAAIEVNVVARQPMNTPTQSLETKDGQEVVAGGVIIFSINDAVKAWGKDNWSPEATAGDITQAAIVHVVAQWDHDELLENISGKVEDQLTEKCRKDLRKFGIYPARVALTDFCSTRSLNHSGIRLEVNTGEVV
jgi:regulator of protease activity HflC (stomatin/prohibitin superfamily)